MAIAGASRGKLSRKFPKDTPILVSIESRIQTLSALDLAILQLPEGLSPWEAAQNISKNARMNLMTVPLLRAADFALSTKSIDASGGFRSLFEHTDAAQLVKSFLESLERSGCASTSRQPVARGIKATFFFNG